MQRIPARPAVRVFGREEMKPRIQWGIRAARSTLTAKQQNVCTTKIVNAMPDISESVGVIMSATAKRLSAPAFAVSSKCAWKKEIEKERAQLDEMIKYGLDSEKILKQSRKLDRLIEKHYKSIKK